MAQQSWLDVGHAIISAGRAVGNATNTDLITWLPFVNCVFFRSMLRLSHFTIEVVTGLFHSLSITLIAKCFPWLLVQINWLLSSYKENCNSFRTILIYIQQDATLHSLFYLENCSTCFGWYHHPSSGAQTTVSTGSGICHTVSTDITTLQR